MMELRIEEALQQESTRNRAVYMRGKAMFIGECVELQECLYDGRLKNPYVIQALVQGTHQYDVNLAFSKNGNCRKKQCNCFGFRADGHSCKHVVATLLAAQAQQTAKQLNFVVIAMPDGEQANDNERHADSQNDSQLISLTPVFIFEAGMYYLELRIAQQRAYVVKSIPQLLHAIEHHKHVTYGKELAFVHDFEQFTTSSKRLITMLSLLDKQLKRQAYTFRDKYDERRLKIGANIVTMLVERETTVLLQCEGQLHSYTRVATLPNFHLLSQMRTDAITLRFARHDGMSGVYGSSQHALLIWERSVYVFSKREQQLAMILQLLTDLGGEVTYRGEHIRFFYEQVLPLIGPYVQDPEHVTITKNPTD
ncbi:MAG: SWIM zinc finger family protein, partial [Culicoidibacterales bacterium]